MILISLSCPYYRKANLNVDGGILRLNIRMPEDVKVASEGSLTGGLYAIKINDKRVPLNFIEQEYESATSKLNLKTDITGGILSLNIVKSKSL